MANITSKTSHTRGIFFVFRIRSFTTFVETNTDRSALVKILIRRHLNQTGTEGTNNTRKTDEWGASVKRQRRNGTKKGFQCRRGRGSSFEGTRNFLHSKHSCGKFRARKSWQILRVAFHRHPLPPRRLFARAFFSMFPRYANERIRDSTTEDAFTFRRAYCTNLFTVEY